MIGVRAQKPLTKREIVNEIQSAKFDKATVFENVTSAKEVEDYMRLNRQLTHSIIVVSHR